MNHHEVRTNWFSVLDEDAFKALLAIVETDGGRIKISERWDCGQKKIRIDCNSDIHGIRDSAGDLSFDSFMAKLAYQIADDDAAILICFDGIAIATSRGWDYMDYDDLYTAAAAKLLGDSGFETYFD